MKAIKKLTLFAFVAFSLMFTSKSFAQDVETYIYNRTDTKTHTTYSIKMEFRGYQIKIWARASSAKGTTAWSPREITYSDDHEIRYSKTGNNGQKVNYSITYDEYNHDAIFLYNEGSGTEYKYYLAQN